MSELVSIGLAIWTGVLTITTLTLVRQMAVFAVRLEASGAGRPAGNIDGLEIGRAVSPEVIATIPEAAKGPVYLLLTSATCSPCRELVPQLAKAREVPRTVALVPGRSELAATLVEQFPAWIQTVVDPVASSLAKALELQRTPFLLEIESGHVTAKSYMHTVRDFEVIVRARSDGRRRLPSPLREALEDVHATR
ncbi:MAG TPA: hypothetical protein VI056_10895 [Candidatus Limnocylindria bacterium]